MRDSNPRPSNCKSAALATELMARIDGIYIIYRHGDGNATEKYRLHHICANRRIWRSLRAIAPPRSPSRHRSPSKLIDEYAARRFAGRRGEQAGGERWGEQGWRQGLAIGDGECKQAGKAGAISDMTGGERYDDEALRIAAANEAR